MSSDWYRDPAAVIEQARLASASSGSPPAIDGYDDLLELKRGGQGVVYRATQRSTRRTVAIKVLLDGAFASASDRRRFEREIDLVAGMRHANIVRIYDSGSDRERRPYYVMDYIEGCSLDELMAGTPLSIEASLKLFATICNAVQHAQQRGVIHRDLKPNNIRIDATGEPHILDFGLAKLSTAGGSSAMTQSGHFLGSLPWASPEQAEGHADRVDVRTDVYSLGVILFQMLTGQFPYDVAGPLRTVLDNILRAEPPRPSRIRTEVNDELDTIVLKCLAKEPERRYQSVGELARDIQHYLAGEPIEARAASAWYTLRKTLRRYQLAVAAAGVIVLVTIAGFATSLVFYGKAVQQSDLAVAERMRADAERVRAENKSRQAEAVSAFLAEMLGSPDPFSRGRDVRVMDVLNNATAKIDTALANDPQTAVAVRGVLGRSYLALGMLDESAEQLEAADALAQKHLQAEAAETLTIPGDLARLRMWQGRLDAAEDLGRRTLEARQRVLGADHPDTLETRGNLAYVLRARGRFDESIALDRQNLAAQERSTGLPNAEALSTRARLGSTLRMAGRLDEAQAMLESALDGCEAALGEEHPYTITAIGALGALYDERKQSDRASSLMSRAAALSAKVYGVEHPATLTAEKNSATLMLNGGRAAEAIPLLRRVLEIEQRTAGEEHPSVLITLSNLAVALTSVRELDEAEALDREAIALATRTLGPEHPDTLLYRSNLAVVLVGLNRYADAEALLRPTLDAARRILPAGHWSIANYQNLLGRSLRLQRRFDEAEPHLLASLDGFVASLGEGHPYVREALDDLVALYGAWEKPARAEEFRARIGQSR